MEQRLIKVMMIKSLKIIVLCSVLQFTYAQEEIGRIDISNIKSSGTSNFSINNQKNGNILTALAHRKNITVYLQNKDFEQIRTPLSRNLDYGKLNSLVGYKIIGNEYSLIYSNAQRGSLAIFSFSFDTKKMKKQKLI